MKFPVRKLDARFHGDGWRQQSPEERQNDMFLVHLSRKMRTASKNPSATANMRHFPQSAICKVWAGLFNHGSLCLFGTFGDPHLHQGGFHLLEHHREMRSFLHWGSFFQIDSAMICLYNIYNIYISNFSTWFRDLCHRGHWSSHLSFHPYFLDVSAHGFVDSLIDFWVLKWCMIVALMNQLVHWRQGVQGLINKWTNHFYE